MDTVILDKEMLEAVRPSNLHLSIEASERSFGFALLDLLNNRYVGIGYRNFNTAYYGNELVARFEAEFEKDGLNKIPFSKSSFTWIGPKSTLVPEPLFDEQQAENYYTLNQGPLENETLHFEKIKPLGAYNVFSVPNALNEFFSKHLKSSPVLHHSRVLLENLLLGGFDKPKVFLHVQSKHFDIVVLEGGALKLHNYYSYISSEDFTYHTLNTCKQWGFNPQTLEVTLVGEVEAQSQLADMLRKYIGSVEFYTPTPAYSLSLELGKLPKHFYFNLLNQQACVL